jgi:ribonuclease G
VIYEDLGLALRTLRDLVNPKIEKIRIDSRETFQKTTQFVGELMPEIADRLEHYPGERPIFDLYGVEDEIQRALERKVPLKSGGYLVVDPAEAMTTIDVNTGAFVGHRNLEETIFKTNLEAATAIARQLRLRNIGGIIIIDFIDMEDEEHQRQVLRTLEKQLERDHAKTNIIGITELGLVQMTRKRTRESLEQVLCEPCSLPGARQAEDPETICYEIFREIFARPVPTRPRAIGYWPTRRWSTGCWTKSRATSPSSRLSSGEPFASRSSPCIPRNNTTWCCSDRH